MSPSSLELPISLEMSVHTQEHPVSLLCGIQYAVLNIVWPSSLQMHYLNMKISVYLYCPFSSWPSCLFIALCFVLAYHAFAAILFHC